MSAETQIQEDVFNRLKNDSYFAGMNVVLARSGVTTSDIEANLLGRRKTAGQFGAAVIVEMPTERVPQPNIPGPRFEVNLEVNVREFVALNRSAQGTNKSAEDISERVIQLIHQFQAGSGRTYRAVQKLPYNDGDGLIGRDCTFVTEYCLDPLRKSPQPKFDDVTSAPQLTFESTTGTVYYTTDGSYPQINGTSTTAWSAVPFDPAPSGTVYRAINFLSIEAQSNCSEYIVP